MDFKTLGISISLIASSTLSNLGSFTVQNIVNSTNSDAIYASALKEYEETGLISASTTKSFLEAEFGLTSPMVQVARCESGFRQYDTPNHVTRNNKTYDVGVLQVNVEYHGMDAKKAGFNIYTLKGNVGFAKSLYEKYGLDPWLSSSKCWKPAIQT